MMRAPPFSRLRKAGARWWRRISPNLMLTGIFVRHPRRALASLRRARHLIEASGFGVPRTVLRYQLENDLLYDAWANRFDTLSAKDLRLIAARIEARPGWPLISVAMAVHGPSPHALDAAIWSVRRQLYPHWELCIADASTDPEVRAVPADHAAADKRIKISRSETGDIAGATNSALELAEGPFVALLNYDDLIPPHALYWVAEELVAHPDTDLLYSDFDRVEADGWRTQPHFKTAFSLERLLGQNTISHLGVYRRALVEQLGGMRPDFEGSEDYDLALRVVAASNPSRIRHIPAVLCHRRTADGASASSNAVERRNASARRAVEAYLATERVTADVVPSFDTSWRRIRYRLPDPAPTVSIIMPTRNRATLLRQAANGVLSATHYPAMKLVIADNDSDDADALALLSELARDPRVNVLRMPGQFNFSAINNEAVAACDGEVLVLLNNDVEVIDPEWLQELVSRALQPGVRRSRRQALLPRRKHPACRRGARHARGGGALVRESAGRPYRPGRRAAAGSRRVSGDGRVPRDPAQRI